jgi:hypothetical protein
VDKRRVSQSHDAHSPIAKTLAYSLKREKELALFLSDGRLEIDNNKIENEIRPIALGADGLAHACTGRTPQRKRKQYRRPVTSKN